VQRGEVWWVQFDEQRPVVLLSDDRNASGSQPEGGWRAVQIVAASGADIGGLGVEVAVGASDDLPFEGVVRVAFPRPGLVPCTWVTAVGPDDLVERVGVLSSVKLSEIDEALDQSDLIGGGGDRVNDVAEAKLADIRQALRRGALTTRQIGRDPGLRRRS
jgi:mRNA interferase MazF